jgi:hypothetical protein
MTNDVGRQGQSLSAWRYSVAIAKTLRPLSAASTRCRVIERTAPVQTELSCGHPCPHHPNARRYVDCSPDAANLGHSSSFRTPNRFRHCAYGTCVLQYDRRA